MIVMFLSLWLHARQIGLLCKRQDLGKNQDPYGCLLQSKVPIISITAVKSCTLCHSADDAFSVAAAVSIVRTIFHVD